MTQHERTKYDPLGRMSWEEKYRDMEKRMYSYQLAAVALLDPTVADKCREGIESIGGSHADASNEIHMMHRNILGDIAHKRVVAANPSTRDFSLQGLPDDAPLDVDEQFNKWVNRNQALSEDCKQKLINRQSIDMVNIVFHGSWPWK